MMRGRLNIGQATDRLFCAAVLCTGIWDFFPGFVCDVCGRGSANLRFALLVFRAFFAWRKQLLASKCGSGRAGKHRNCHSSRENLCRGHARADITTGHKHGNVSKLDKGISCLDTTTLYSVSGNRAPVAPSSAFNGGKSSQPPLADVLIAKSSIFSAYFSMTAVYACNCLAGENIFPALQIYRFGQQVYADREPLKPSRQ